MPHLNSKPNVVLSACLNGENVRYDGKLVKDEFIDKLKKYINVIPVCPEVSIGLPVPRDRIILVRENNSYKVYRLPDGKDLTDKLENFSKEFLNSLKNIDGFILKAKSPSCGLQGTKTYKTPYGKGYIGRRKGIFALNVLQNFKNYPLTDEIDLKDLIKRYEFLTKLYLFFFFRNTSDKKEFISRYEKVLNLFSKKGTDLFKSKPTFDNFLRIFNRNLSEKLVNKKILNFKEKLLTGELEDYIVFPSELLEK